VPNLKQLIIIFLTGFALSGCMNGEWPTGQLAVKNGDATAIITDIYITFDCSDRWGNVDYTSLSIAPGASSEVYDLETHVYDVLACFDTGTCGQALDVEVYDVGVTEVTIVDSGTIIKAPANCL